METWASTALPAAIRTHAAKAFHANRTIARASQILHQWRAYAAVRAFKHTLTARAAKHRMRCVVAHAWHVWQERVNRTQRKHVLTARASLHCTHAVLGRSWDAWQWCMHQGRQERRALQVADMHRRQVMALRGLRGFSESLHRRYLKRLATTHSKVTAQRCAVSTTNESALHICEDTPVLPAISKLCLIETQKIVLNIRSFSIYVGTTEMH